MLPAHPDVAGESDEDDGTQIRAVKVAAPHPSESVLVSLAGGDPGAMDALNERYGRLIWWMARRWNRHQADAEDAVQEIMLDIWKSAASFDPSLGREETYISVIARRRLVDRHRSAKAQKANSFVELMDSSAVTPETSRAETGEECRRAMHVLASLGGDQDEVLRLAYAEGYTFRRIAQQMGLPVATVVSRAQRGLQRLQHLLAHPERDGGADARENGDGDVRGAPLNSPDDLARD